MALFMSPMIDSSGPSSEGETDFPFLITCACGDGSTLTYWIGGAPAPVFLLPPVPVILSYLSKSPFICCSSYWILSSSFSSLRRWRSFSASFSRLLASIYNLSSSLCCSSFRYFSYSRSPRLFHEGACTVGYC